MLFRPSPLKIVCGYAAVPLTPNRRRSRVGGGKIGTVKRSFTANRVASHHFISDLDYGLRIGIEPPRQPKRQLPLTLFWILDFGLKMLSPGDNSK
jgi:hypothetical protein